jgi:hypothetical protein
VLGAAVELETSMNQVQVEEKRYQMPPTDGIAVAHFLTVADIERSARFYEKIFGGHILSRVTVAVRRVIFRSRTLG